jgi:hypothetical protein
MKRHLLLFLILLTAGTAIAQSHVSDLVVTPASGGTIKWYNDPTAGTQYTDPTNTALVNGTTYYASQTVNGVESTARKAVTVTLNVLPATDLTVGGAGAVCSGTGTNITVANSVSGINYQLMKGATSVGSAVAGTGASINLPTGNLTVESTTFSVKATNATTGCTATLTGTAIVTVNPLPTPTFTTQPGATVSLNTNVTYTTNAANTNYLWTYPGTVNVDYTIISGGASNNNTVTLQWKTPGYKIVYVNYTNASGCTAASPSGSTTIVDLAIGDAYQGGKIAYIDGSGAHGLIAATDDQSTGIEWITGGNTQITQLGNSTWANIGSGQANTNAMKAQLGYTGGAAKVCDDYTIGVYSDWYLPSLDELNKLYLNRIAIGNFASTDWVMYWSSYENNAISANLVIFGGASAGGLSAQSKASPYRVRAIRSF